MNRFRSRKKSDGGQSAGPSRRPSIDNDIPAMPSMPSFASKTFRRKKQASPPPQPEAVDLATALPSSDDFRTSLLMPNLSARFSMLREQDDPTSKIGKANDDSVLFPKRASRLDLFNRKGLSDIVEVDSIRGSIRPPFASARTESYGSGSYDTDEGGVMSRSRPGEGNTMFGGRQKIYKIPVGGSGSVKNFNAEEGDLPTGGNMGGKALYEEDMAPSAFQKLREQERQERERAGQDHLRSSHDQDRSGSPPLAKYNRNRETSSSTNSGPSQPRTSTAATSVASQRSTFETINGTSSTQPSSAGSDRPGLKGRRMYGQGLDQHMHERQSSALHRLASLQTQRTTAAATGTPRDLIQSRRQSRSASNLHDRYQRTGPLYASNGFRAASPAPSGTPPPRMQDFDLGLGDEPNGNNHTDSGYSRSPPLSPPMSTTNDRNGSDPLVAALEPNDLGKATASGAFNKPKVMYNEQQYLQRQLQLQEGRGTPSPQLNRPFSPQAHSIDEKTNCRSRNNSLGSQLSRTNSSRQPWEHHMEDHVLRPVQERGSGTNSPSLRESEDPNDRNFFAGVSGSETASQRESESEPSSPMPSTTKSHNFSQPIPPQAKPVELKQQLNFNPDPIHLLEPAKDLASDSRSHRSEATITQQRNDPSPEYTNAVALDADSPTLGPVSFSNGLSGLVREHLRKQSDQSSIYPEDSPTMNGFSDVRYSIFGHKSALQSHSRNHSYDEAEADRQYWANQKGESDQTSVAAPPPPLSFVARHILEQATALRDNYDNPKAQQMLGNDKAHQILGGHAPGTNSGHARSNSATWHEQLKAHHSRGASTETQKEREDLANELAERRRMVQNNLRTYAESSSRSASPGPGARTQDNSPARGHPFGVLKKSSKTTLAGNSQHQERPSKAMKMLGINPGNGPGPMSNAPQLPPDMFMGSKQLSDRAMPPKQRLPPQQMTQPRRPQDVRQHSDTPSSFNRQRKPVGGLRSQENLVHQRRSPPSSKAGPSYSDTPHRRSPESRKVNGNGIMRPNIEQGRANGFSPNGAAAGPVQVENQNKYGAPRPMNELMASLNRHGQPPAERSQSAMSGRFRSRSNSRTTAVPGYFESRAAPPNAPFMINPAGRPSNGRPYPHSSSSTPSVNDSRPSLSSQASSTPTIMPPHSAPSSSHGHNRSGHGGRKRSVNKHHISDPSFLSCTSSVDTVELPPEASLRNGMDSPPSPTKAAPPIPARDSRRKRTQTLLQALGRIQSPESSHAKRDHPPSPHDETAEVQSTFSADEDEQPDRRTMRRLRKTSSEGGNMNKMAREKIMQSQSQSQVTSPAVPCFPVRAREMQKSPIVTDVEEPMDGHFAYQARQDVPASAVMF